MTTTAPKKLNSKSAKLRVHVGTVNDMGARFVDTWQKAQQGEHVCESHVTFLDLATLIGMLSTRRLELLRQTRKQGGYPSIRALANALGRDYKNVHDDVSTLVAAGLLVQEGRRISAPWDEVQANLSLG